jgi:hypothetical protein
MKHAGSRELYAYWDKKRGKRAAPERAEIEPGAIRNVLSDAFILALDGGAGHPFRLAGTRVCALFGRELKSEPFIGLWAAASQRTIDRREFPCQVVNMSPGGIALIAPVAGATGERIIAYVDHLGRLEGHTARIFQNGFAMTISATSRKRDKLAAQLTWLANRHLLASPEDRRHGRRAPVNPSGRLILPNGVNLTCRIIDILESGAGVATDQRPPLGSL